MKRAMMIPWLLLAVSGAALADAGDPPARVARLNYMSGSVSFRPANVEDWAEATLNYPLTTGDHLWADEGAGAEMHVGSAAVRLASQTAVEFLNLDDRVARLSVPQGGLNVRIRQLDPDQTFEVDTPNGAILLLRAGEYRIDVDPDHNSTHVTVRSGEAQVTGAGNPFSVRDREMAFFGGDPFTSEIGAARAPDGWDQWCVDRDRREDQETQVSARYVPPEMVGTEDLGDNGVWSEVPDYGPVWTPRVPVGWAPYHYGHWAWVEPWGWTWIDDAPWGFAPFHYGRWGFGGGVWFWVPGARVARPVYAPHLAVFAGVGAGVAWFPLGPREVYVPSYRVSATYVRQVNITHVRNFTPVTNEGNVRYVNRTVPGAVTAVPQGAFAGRRSVSQSAVAVSPQEISRAQVAHTAPVGREAAMVRTPSPRVAQPPARIQQRTVVSRPARDVRPAPAPIERRNIPTPDRPAAVREPVREEPRRQITPEPRQQQPPAVHERPVREEPRRTEPKAARDERRPDKKDARKEEKKRDQ